MSAHAQKCRLLDWQQTATPQLLTGVLSHLLESVNHTVSCQISHMTAEHDLSVPD